MAQQQGAGCSEGLLELCQEARAFLLGPLSKSEGGACSSAGCCPGIFRGLPLSQASGMQGYCPVSGVRGPVLGPWLLSLPTDDALVSVPWGACVQRFHLYVTAANPNRYTKKDTPKKITQWELRESSQLVSEGRERHKERRKDMNEDSVEEDIYDLERAPHCREGYLKPLTRSVQYQSHLVR